MFLFFLFSLFVGEIGKIHFVSWCLLQHADSNKPPSWSSESSFLTQSLVSKSLTLTCLLFMGIYAHLSCFFLQYTATEDISSALMFKLSLIFWFLLMLPGRDWSCFISLPIPKSYSLFKILPTFFSSKPFSIPEPHNYWLSWLLMRLPRYSSINSHLLV